MKRVFKYPLRCDFINSQKLKIPKGSKFLKVHTQGESIKVWFEVTDDKEMEEVFFVTVETGKPLPSNPMKYLDSVFMFRETYVIHVYQLT